MDRRRRVRVLAFQVLFQLDCQGTGFLSEIGQFLEHNEQSQATRTSAEALARQAWDMHEQVDDLIRQAAARWELSRIAAVDRAILRLALCELLEGRTPEKVLLNEAIELAKEYSTAESGAFVNAVLDAVRKRLREQHNTADNDATL